MDDLQEVPTSDLPEQSQEVPAHDLPAPSGEVPASDLPQEFGGAAPTSTVGAALEGVAKGVAGPVATAGELGLSKLGVPGLSAEEQKQRELEHPVAEGSGQVAGLLGGAFIPGVGEYTLGSLATKAAGAAAKTAELGKIGSFALKGAIESGLFQSSDEASKYILGESDPSAPVGSALAHIGAATLLGGGLGSVFGKAGSKLEELAAGKTASSASQFLADFGNRFKFLQENPDLASAATEEAQHMFDTVSSATQSGFGLKREAIEKLTENMAPDEVSSHIQQVADWIKKADPELTGDKLFQKEFQKWQSKTFPGNGQLPSAADVFDASDQFKRQLQEWGQYNKKLVPLSEQPFRNAARGLADSLKTNLESPEVWGDMGAFQQKLNSAYSEMQAPLKDFISSAVSKKEGIADTVDPAKISSIFRSVTKGKPLTGFRADKVADFFPKARNFLEAVDDLHSGMGLESNIPKVSTNVLDEMLNGDVSKGTKFADWLFGAGPGSIGRLSAHVIGSAAGHAAAPLAGPAGIYTGYRMGEHMAPMLSEGLGKKLTRWGVAGALRALTAGDVEGVPQAEHYAESIGKGTRKINDSIANIFTTGGQKALNQDFSESDREKLKKYVEGGALNQQIQNQAQPKTQNPVVQQGFAHGGEVIAPEPHQVTTKPVGKAVKADHVANAFPEQSMMLGMAKGRINNYLNSIRPQAIKQKLPFDEDMPNKEHERSYHRALDIANKPLSVLDHIKNGTLEPEHVAHMQGLYPELSDHLRKKLTEKITETQMKNEKPPHKVRQGLSLFMGSALDSNLTPMNIQAAQATFMAQGSPQPMQSGKPNKSTDKLGEMANQYRTTEQSTIQRQDRTKV